MKTFGNDFIQTFRVKFFRLFGTVRNAQRKHVLAAHQVIHRQTEAMLRQNFAEQKQDEVPDTDNLPEEGQFREEETQNEENS